MKPEHRIKVLDMSSHWSGSVASRRLAHLGADVVKLENPKIGDGNRGLGPYIEGEGISHLALNAGKRSVAIDRRGPKWGELFGKAVRWSDVFILGLPPGVAKKRGLDFETIAKLNDRIVYCNISGYGEIGPMADATSHGLNPDVFAGAVPVESRGDQVVAAEHYRSLGTTLAGIEAVGGILEALRRRDLGYGAQYVATSMWEAAMAWQWRDITTIANTGKLHPAYSDLGSRYALYRTADDRVLLICPVERKFWERFVDIVKLPVEWKGVGSWDTGGADSGEGREDERRAISARIAQQSLAYWMATFAAADIPYSPLQSLGEAIDTDQGKAVGVTTTTTVKGHKIRIPSIPVHIASASEGATGLMGAGEISPPPMLGEHTDQFLLEIQEF